MEICASPRSSSRSDVDGGVQGGLVEIQRAIKSQQAIQQIMQRELTDVATSLKLFMETQKNLVFDIGSVVKKMVEPITSSLEVNGKTEASPASSYKREDEEELDRTMKKYLDPIRSDIVSLHDIVFKSANTDDRRSAKDDQTISSPHGTNAEDLQKYLRQELQAFEKSLAACIEENLTRVQAAPRKIEFHEQPPETPEAGHSAVQLQEQRPHMPKNSAALAQIPSHSASFVDSLGDDPRMSFDNSHGVTKLLTKSFSMLSVSAKGHGQSESAVRSPGKTIKSKIPPRVDDQTGSPIKVKESSAISAVFSLDTDLQSKPYHTEDYYKDQGICQAIARSMAFEAVNAIAVIANAVYIGIEADVNEAPNIYNAGWGFIFFSQFFGVFFLADLIIRYIAFKRTIDAFRDGWFVFDFFLVVTMALELWIAMPVFLVISGDGVSIPTQPLRLVRLLKILRMGRLMQVFPELVTMVLGLVRSLRAILSTLLLILLMMYVWAIFLLTLMRNEHETNHVLKTQYDFEFSTMAHCLWTLLMDGVLQLDNAAMVMTTLLWDDRFKIMLAGFAFTLFSLLSSLLILQMLIGIMCDVVAQVGAEQRKSKAIQIMKHELLDELFRRDNGDGCITKEEFEACTASESCMAVFRHLKINPTFFSELASLFYVDSDTAVPVVRLLELLMLCQGECHITVDLLTIVLSYLSNELVEMESRIVSHFGTRTS